MGWSNYSPIECILMASAPSQITPEPTVSYSGVNVLIQWTAPSTNGDPITAYDI
jgi:hypothetical protein